MMTVRMMLTRKLLRMALAWAMISVALLGVAASCGGEEGTWQGGNDSEPGWRR